ncbi:UPF0175 family protein [Aneurinibacillus aneurinilyticus]|uniref:UPF0175 family protein n=2 Tax=Aneurinibacillus aneurinilyticus TaxID=1391 RepID=A0A848CUX4_ANEAE|nr:UPF0175 family protein [Aneurinibacillus aneurinilyticus]ERI07190.1 putative toxin-antitoxin system, antitoxin component [Aneurinibacillus aneurinilyticus ATCC 12856]MCI1696500.1 UPF0175 family protein [Aneurinibacillus aneurinilyticus]MED0709744.1 UPF0175 family protein [Aneurinibacillus aneurinilyticus]MED0726479.1 UPF0175 family protein [Aneurinibacillus aneurinilyticus]MED0733019.1 UPF0175 family protein [Aneurinibacillus aneurinilyticus]
MEKSTPEIRVPEEFLHVIDKTGYGTSLDQKLRVSLAIGLFAERAVTLERAAELAEKPLSDFIKILSSKKIPWMEYTEDHVEDDNIAIDKYFQRE